MKKLSLIHEAVLGIPSHLAIDSKVFNVFLRIRGIECDWNTKEQSITFTPQFTDAVVLTVRLDLEAVRIDLGKGKTPTLSELEEIKTVLGEIVSKLKELRRPHVDTGFN